VSDDVGDGDPSVDPADAFGALSDPVRVGIVRALTEHARESWADPGLGFAALRRRVGVDDPGRFRYHLERLRGRFVEQVDGDYRLTYAGGEVAAAILAGTYTERRSVGPATLDSTCPLCDSAVTGHYTDGTLTVACEADHLLFLWGLPPNAAADATVPDLVAAARRSLEHAVDWSLAGRCSRCFAPAVTEAFTEPDTPGVRFRARCHTCGARLVGPLGFALLGHPEVEALYRRHGRSTREVDLWTLPFVGHGAPEPVDGEAREDEDEDAYRITVELGDERLVVGFDARGRPVRTRTVVLSDFE
jgi:hypothetical protein